MLFRIDTFSVPAPARPAFEEMARATMRLLAAQPGFIRSKWYEKLAGPGSADIVTVAEWRDEASVERAGAAVHTFHAENGFDAGAFAREHGIVESKAIYELSVDA